MLFIPFLTTICTFTKFTCSCHSCHAFAKLFLPVIFGSFLLEYRKTVRKHTLFFLDPNMLISAWLLVFAMRNLWNGYFVGEHAALNETYDLLCL